MAYQVFPVTSPYPGPLIAPMIQTAVASNGVFKVFGFTPKTGIKSKYMRGTFSNNAVIQKQAWQADNLDTSTYSEESKNICAYMVAGQIRNDTLNATSLELQLAQGIWSEQVQQTDLWQAWFDQELAQIARGYNQLALTGEFTDSLYTYSLVSDCSGLLSIINAEGNVYNGTLSALLDSNPASASNVYTELQALIRTLPVKFRYGQDGAKARNQSGGVGVQYAGMRPYIIGVSAAVYETLEDYQRRYNAAFNLVVLQEYPEPKVDSYRVAVVDWLPDDQVIYMNGDDLLLVTDLESDATQLNFVNLQQASPIRHGFEYRLDFRLATDLGQPERTVLGIFS